MQTERRPLSFSRYNDQAYAPEQLMTTAAVYIGKHRFQHEPPDICHEDYVGEVSAQDVSAMFVQVERAAEGQPFVFVLANCSRATMLTAEARKLGAEGMRDPRYKMRAIAVYGASYRMRVIIELLARVAAIFARSGGVDNPFRIFETEAQARAWLDVRRRELQRGTS